MKPVHSAKPYFHPDDRENILADIKKILETGQLIMGDNLKQFEEDFAKYTECKYGVGVISGTAALQILYQYYDVKDKEVIVPTNTFMATATAVIYAGGTPIIADIDPDYLCSGPNEIREKITDKTKGVCVVHLGGLVHPKMDEIKALCKEKGLFLIEDASHAHGSEYHGKKVGSLTDAACFSFYPTKVFTTGSGGMIVTDDEKLKEFAISVRHHGAGTSLLDINKLGNHWVMNEILATIGKDTLPRLDEWVDKRNHIADIYTKGLKNNPKLKLILPPENTKSAYYKYSIVLDDSIDRDKMMEILGKEYQIGTGALYWPSVHTMPLMKYMYGYKEGDLPKSEKALKQAICLPMHVQITDEDAERVVHDFQEAMEKCKK